MSGVYKNVDIQSGVASVTLWEDGLVELILFNEYGLRDTSGKLTKEQVKFFIKSMEELLESN